MAQLTNQEVTAFKTLHELMNPQHTNAIGFTAQISSKR
jgi:hypothetical protein